MLGRLLIVQMSVTTALVVQPAFAGTQRRAPAPAMVDIPRVNLPDAVTSPMKDAGLKSPNEMSITEYNNYSAAAIGGTLLLFILPLFDITGFIGDFIFSALIGGGLCIFLTLYKDTAEYGDKFGGAVMKGINKGEELVPVVKDKVQKLIKDIKS